MFTEKSQRDKYVENLKQQLDQWNDEIDKLEARGTKISDDARQKYNAQITELRNQLRSIRTKLKEWQASGQDNWDEFRAQVEHVRKTFTQSYNYFRSQL